MTRDQAFKRTESFNKPIEAAIKGYLENVEYSVRKGEYSYFHNTAQPSIEALQEFIDRYGYRVFIREGNDCNGYPLWCIYWGDEENPLNGFNVSKHDLHKWYELVYNHNENKWLHRHYLFINSEA